MKLCVIANPHARNGRSAAKIREVAREMARQGLPCDLQLCRNMADARNLSAQANRDDYDAVVAVGGDGTINRVLNGFFDSDGTRLSETQFAVVHTGTSPDFCRSYRVPTRIADAVAVLRKRAAKRIRIGRVDWPGSRAPDYFACCANVGFGATLARYANAGIRKWAGDFGGTLLSLLRTLRTYRPRKVEIIIDGQSRTVSNVYDLAVGRTSHIASGIKVHHRLKELDDGFYVVCVHDLTWIRFPVVLRNLYRPSALPHTLGTALGTPVVRNACVWQTYARNIQITSAPPAEVEFDGDPVGESPCAIRAAKDALDLICDEPPHVCETDFGSIRDSQQTASPVPAYE